MPAAKSTFIRYRIIDQCLTSKLQTHWSIQELLAKLREHDICIEDRSLRYDIENMRFDERLGYKAPIEYSKKYKGYYYTEPGFSITKLPLSQEDLHRLSIAAQTFKDYIGVPIFQELEGSIEKLHTAVNQYQNYRNKQHIFQFEKSLHFKGLQYLDSLVDAIIHKKPVKVIYKKFSQKHQYTYHIHPYLLKEYDNRWYLLGLDHDKQKMIVLGLDRIESLEHHNIPFVMDKEFDADTFFRNTIGVTYTGKVEEVVLMFSKNLAPYIRNLPIHETQTIVSDATDRLTISLHLIVNYELTSLILSYGSQAKVLKPVSLSKKVAEEMRKCFDNYNLTIKRKDS